MPTLFTSCPARRGCCRFEGTHPGGRLDGGHAVDCNNRTYAPRRRGSVRPAMCAWKQRENEEFVGSASEHGMLRPLPRRGVGSRTFCIGDSRIGFLRRTDFAKLFWKPTTQPHRSPRGKTKATKKKEKQRRKLICPHRLALQVFLH